MSLGGTAIAFGAMVDVAIVMVKNTRKQLHRRNEAGVGLRWNLEGYVRSAARCLAYPGADLI
jgi:Cu/Ag efflux pump CusA